MHLSLLISSDSCYKQMHLESLTISLVIAQQTKLMTYGYDTWNLAYQSVCFKGTNVRQKTCEIFPVYCIFYSDFMCQTTVIFGITKDGSLVF